MYDSYDFTVIAYFVKKALFLEYAYLAKERFTIHFIALNHIGNCFRLNLVRMIEYYFD